MKPDPTIVWDLGNVLVNWSPRYLYDRIFQDPAERDWFLDQVCTMEWHNSVDGGKPTAEATRELSEKHPDRAHLIEAFYARWREMFQGAIEGSVEILDELRRKNYPQYALTNWSAELFGQSRSDFPFLEWFDGIVLSGAEGFTKPDPRLYLRLLERYGLSAAHCLFIDDKAVNVEAAQNLGMDGILFSDPEALRRDLALRGVL
ncbi:HAD family hydrolase [Flaviaesturariibacter aridisoli]|uniref:HAD family phosphatase n=1 Tax=Flaviaesturariibacter aridisoli TaxID=2545761 RepID=A0A4R4DZV5_9BACT|nr:HAD family phosphatase [Flaviaesturariibacter aridisoli]TCZ72231.1 HAD family phosphatase [Flaviaesturariibacter aridisoli]